MTSTSNTIKPTVDLVIVIDTSPSMRDEAQALSEATATAIRAAASSCPSDLRVSWFGIEGRWNGTNFNRTVRNYLAQVCKVPGNQLRGRRRGELASAGAQEDGARAIEDLVNHFDWRIGAARAILYLGDEALEGGGDRTEQADIAAANQALQAAKAAGVKIHTYFGTSKSKYRDGISSEYQRLADETGGQAFNDQDAIDGFALLLEKVICGSRSIPKTSMVSTQTQTPLKSGVAYVQDSITGENSKLYRLDLTTGKATLVSTTAPEVADLAFVGHQLYGIAIKPGSQTSQLLNINPTTGQTTVIGNIGFAVTGLAYDPIRQSLYGTTAKQLILINPTTGLGSPVMTVADQKHNCGEVAFDRQGNAYVTLISAERRKFLAACDLTTGNIRTIGDIGFPNLASMKFYGNTLYGVTGSFFNLGKDGELIQINTNTGKGTLITLTDPIGRWAGFEIYDELPQKIPASPSSPVTPGVTPNQPPTVSQPRPPVGSSPVSVDKPSGGVSSPSSPGVSVTSGTTPNKPPTVSQPRSPVGNTPVAFDKPSTGSVGRPQQQVPVNLQNINFDSFERNPQQDIICVTPVRTIVRREEEITLIRRVRKVEEIDASPACPANTTQV